MGNYENLKQSITEVIRTNGNQEITGAVLQSTLLTIISTVGANAAFAGIATPATNPGTPDGPVFYLASESGTYSNFGSIELQDGLSVLMWNGSWSSQQILSIDDVPTAGSDNLVKSGGVFNNIGAFDISELNATENPHTLATYEDLSSALNALPTSYRKGGMSVKFVQSSDNNYVQYLYKVASTTNVDFTNVHNWEKTNLENELIQLKGIFANRFIFSATTNTYKSEFVAYHFVNGHSYFVHIENPEGVNVLTYTSVRTSDGTALQNRIGSGSITRDIRFTCNVDNGEGWYLTVVPAHDTELSFNATIIDLDVVSLEAIKVYLDSDGYVTNSKLAPIISKSHSSYFSAYYNNKLVYEVGTDGIFITNFRCFIRGAINITINNIADLLSALGMSEYDVAPSGADAIKIPGYKVLVVRNGSFVVVDRATFDMSDIFILSADNKSVDAINPAFQVDGRRILDGTIVTSKLADNSVISRNVNINILPNIFISPKVTPNVNTQYGYISFGTIEEALYITTVKGKIVIEGDSYKTDGEYRAYFKDGTTNTASSIIFIYIDTVNKNFVSRGQDKEFNDTQSRYILLGSVVCAYTSDGSYRPNSFRRASFPFEYTVNGSSEDADLNSIKSYTPYGTDILTLNPQNEILPVLKDFKHRIRNSEFAEQGKQLVLLQLTDQHADEARMNRAMKFASKYSSYIDDVIHTGDIVYDNWASGLNWFANVQNKENIMQVIGNHDVAVKSGSDGNVYIDPNDLSQYIETTGYVYLNKTDNRTLGYKNTDNEIVWVNYDDIYNRYIAPYVSNWEVVQPSNAASEGLNYYYKDYTEQGIRLIVLDSMMYDTAQNTWLVSVLADAKTNGYGVIIAEHYPIQLDGFEYCAFTSSGGDDVLDFYQSEGSSSTLANAQLAVDNFMNDGGEFICWLAGHTHKDFCGTLKNYPKQVMFVSDITGLNHLAWGDEVRTVGTKTEDCFSIISIDRYKKIVRLYRVGNQWDRYGRHKVSMAFDYRAAKMIYSS